MATLNIGDEVPDFELPAVTGNIKTQFKLSDYRGKKNVVLAFYPADWTPVCASQLPAIQYRPGALRRLRCAGGGHQRGLHSQPHGLAEERDRHPELSRWPATSIRTARWQGSLGFCAKAIPSPESTSARSLWSTRTGSSRSARSIPSDRFPATTMSSRC